MTSKTVYKSDAWRRAISVACRKAQLLRFGTFDERFERKIERTDTCWFWTGGKDKDGYGLIKEKGKSLSAHRVALEKKLQRPLRPGYFSCHSCDVNACVNPDHLFEGTVQDNTDDRVAKGRGATGDRHGLRLHPERFDRGEGGRFVSMDERRDIALI